MTTSMPTNPPPRPQWQFGLRTALFAIVVAAILFAQWRQILRLSLELYPESKLGAAILGFAMAYWGTHSTPGPRRKWTLTGSLVFLAAILLPIVAMLYLEWANGHWSRRVWFPSSVARPFPFPDAWLLLLDEALHGAPMSNRPFEMFGFLPVTAVLYFAMLPCTFAYGFACGRLCHALRRRVVFPRRTAHSAE